MIHAVEGFSRVRLSGELAMDTVKQAQDCQSNCSLATHSLSSCCSRNHALHCIPRPDAHYSIQFVNNIPYLALKLNGPARPGSYNSSLRPPSRSSRIKRKSAFCLAAQFTQLLRMNTGRERDNVRAEHYPVMSGERASGRSQ